ncbi:MAG: XdhC family protein [Pseudohongiellaceae bacterium]
MQSSQQHIITRVSEWLVADKPAWLCTILKTWGSSPRPVGAMMACTLDGDLVGSISGGCIEEDFLQQLREGALKQQFDKEQKPFTVKYGITSEEQARLKLPCGGQLHVLLEFITATPPNKEVFQQLADSLAKHTPVCRLVNLRTGEVSIATNTFASATSTTPATDARTKTSVATDTKKKVSPATANASADAEAVVIAGEVMTHSLSPMYQLLLLGAGDVARYVAELALALEYNVTLCDPRPNYLDNWEVPAVEITSRLPDDVVRERFNDAYSGIIALAHDPRVDDMALMEALKTEAFYVGAMGSERTSAGRRQRLPELGLTNTEIARLHAPIGFQINSKTPAEIAIAIMAEVTAARHATSA